MSSQEDIADFDFWSISSSAEEKISLIISSYLVAEKHDALCRLSELPLSITVVEDEIDLKEKIKSTKPDLLVLDDYYLVYEEIIQNLFCDNSAIPSYQAIIYVCMKPVELAQYRYRQGSEYLQSPFSTSQLIARIHHQIDIITLLKNLDNELSLLRNEKFIAQEENVLVGRYIDNLSQLDQVKNKNFRETIIPLEHLSGDLILTAVNPRGEQFFTLADFTGHGLPAAVGSIVISGIFHSMVSKGFSQDEIVHEINSKLKSFYPTGRYMAAVFIKICRQDNLVEILNCGMPDVLIFSLQERKLYEFSSTSLPLGIVMNHELELIWDARKINKGDRLIAYTDGLTDSYNVDQNAFGKQGVTESIFAAREENDFTDVILERFNLFAAGVKQLDDVSLLEIFLDKEANIQDKTLNGAINKKAMDWSLCLEVKTSMIKENINPVTSVLQYICDIQGLNQHRDTLYTILTELYMNSLEHGILQLDSAIKDRTNGFIEYYELKESRLHDLSDGHLTIRIENQNIGNGGEMLITVEDNGSGFDLLEVESRKPDVYQSNGRGIDLVKSLTDSLKYTDQGRKAIAVYSW